MANLIKRLFSRGMSEAEIKQWEENLQLPSVPINKQTEEKLIKELEQAGKTTPYEKHEVRKTMLYKPWGRIVDVDALIKKFRPAEDYFGTGVKTSVPLYGAMYGDIIGSLYEGRLNKERFPSEEQIEKRCCFTDDSVMTIATAEAILNSVDADIHSEITLDSVENHTTLHGAGVQAFADAYRKWGLKYPDAGYGSNFIDWLHDPEEGAYGSRGNGSAMRIAPVGAAGFDYETTVKLAIASAACTHDDIDGIRGACVTAIAIWMALRGATKEEIFEYMKEQYSHNGLVLFKDFTLSEIEKCKYYQVECQFSVPAAICAVHEANSFREAIENAMQIGFDTDTNAAIAGSIAAVMFGISREEKELVGKKIDAPMLSILQKWEGRQ